MSETFPRLRLRIPDVYSRIAAGLILGQLALVAFLSAGGGLYIDDIRAQAYAAGRPIWPFIIESNKTHLSPGARTVDWLMATYAPLEHWPATVLTLVISGAVGVASWRLLRRIVPDGLSKCVGLFWVLYAPTIVPSLAWFRQALTTMSAVALMIVSLTAYLDFLRTPRGRHFTVALAAHATALMFSERALCLPVVALALAVVESRGRLRRRPAQTWAGPLGAMALVNLAFLYAYTRGQFDHAAGSSPSILDLIRKVSRALFVDTLPMLLGGPVTWRSAGGPYSFASTPLVLVVVSALVFGGLAVAVFRRPTARLPAAAALAVALAYVVPVDLLIYMGRLAQVDSVVAVDDLRLLPDVTIALGFALAVWVSLLTHGGTAIRGRLRLGGSLLAAGTTVVLTCISWLAFASSWHQLETTTYLANLRHDLATTRSSVLPGGVPNSVVPAWVDPDFSTGSLIELLRPQVQTAETGNTATLVGPSGHLVAANLGTAVAAKVPSGFCGQGIPAGSQSTTLTLARPASYFHSEVAEVALLAGDTTELSLSVTDIAGKTYPTIRWDTPELLRGPHRIVGVVPHGLVVAKVVVNVLTANTAGVCVTSARIAVPGAR